MEDREKRIDEILRRVMARLEQAGTTAPAAQAAEGPDAAGRGPFRLLLARSTSDALTACRQALVNAGDEPAVYLADTLPEDTDAVRRASAVIIFDLSVSDLVSAALGQGGSRYAIWIREAILRGKPVLAAKEGVELFAYAPTAPEPYYSRLLGHLKHLIKSGLRLIPLERGKAGLQAAIAGTAPGLAVAEQLTMIGAGRVEKTAAPPTGPAVRHGAAPASAVRIWDRRVLSERDLKQFDWRQIRVIQTTRPVILTDLAREFLARHDIELEQTAD